jgi:site-specific DNA-cytosine methylase
MRHLDLFSGIGGWAIASGEVWPDREMAGFCERDPFCRNVLAKNFPNVKIHGDITALDPSEIQGEIDLLTGSPPCQPFSVAGKRGGKSDDRYLWPAMFRIIESVRPRWVCLEEVAGFVKVALDDVLSDLEGIGYTCRAQVIPAVAVGAPHRRDRLWVVAHRDGRGREGQRVDVPEDGHAPARHDADGRGGEGRHDAHAAGAGLQIAGRAAHGELQAEGREGLDHRPEQPGSHAADHQGYRRLEGRAEPAGKQGRPDLAVNRGAVAYTNRERREGDGDESKFSPVPDAGLSEHVTDAGRAGLQGHELSGAPGEGAGASRPAAQRHWNEDWATVAYRTCLLPDKGQAHAGVQPVDDGLPGVMVRLPDGTEITQAAWRRESLKAAGNSIVPQVAMEIFRAIRKSDNGLS